MGKGKYGCGMEMAGPMAEIISTDADHESPQTTDYAPYGAEGPLGRGLDNEGPTGDKESDYRPWWLNEAIDLYHRDLSLREIGQKFHVSKETVRQWFIREGVRRRDPAERAPVSHVIGPAGDEDPLTAGLNELERRLYDDPNLPEEEKARGRARLNALREIVAPPVYSFERDYYPPFSGEEFHIAFDEMLRRVHIIGQDEVKGFPFEAVLNSALKKVATASRRSKHPNHPGRDLAYFLWNTWVGVSCKSECNLDVTEDDKTLAIRRFVRWGKSIEQAGAKIAEHISDYEHCLDLRVVRDTQYPDDEKLGDWAGKPATRYDLIAVPYGILEQISQLPLKRGPQTVTLTSVKEPPRTFTMRVNLQNSGDTMLSNIPLDEAYWISSTYMPQVER